MRRTIARPQDGARLFLGDAVAAARALLVTRLQRAAALERPEPQARGAKLDEASETEAEKIEMCEIGSWRGYVKWQFYVKSQTPLETSLSSPYFRARGNGAPEQTDTALQAHAALVEQLIAAGWEQDGRGERWFSERFWRGSPPSV